MDSEQKNNNFAILGFFTILLVITISYFVHKVQPQDNKRTLEIQNDSRLNFTIILPTAQKIEVLPKNKISISANIGDEITANAYNFDGTLIKHIYKLTNRDIKLLYIGNSGIFDDKNLTNITTFINDSSIPIIFIEKTIKGDKKWSSEIIPPKSQTSNYFSSRKSVWQVCHPTEETIPIAEITFNQTPRKIVFNGKTIHPF